MTIVQSDFTCVTNTDREATMNLNDPWQLRLVYDYQNARYDYVGMGCF